MPVPAITNLSLSETSPGYVTVTWEWAGWSNNTIFQVEVSQDPNTGFAVVASTPVGGATAQGTYNHVHHQGFGETLYYRVVAVDTVEQEPSPYSASIGISTQGSQVSTALSFSACLDKCCENIILRDLTGSSSDISTGYTAGSAVGLTGQVVIKNIAGDTLETWTVEPSESPASFKKLPFSLPDGVYQLEYSVTDGLGLNLLAKQMIIIDCESQQKMRCVMEKYLGGDYEKENTILLAGTALSSALPSQAKNGEWAAANMTLEFVQLQLQCEC